MRRLHFLRMMLPCDGLSALPVLDCRPTRGRRLAQQVLGSETRLPEIGSETAAPAACSDADADADAATFIELSDEVTVNSWVITQEMGIDITTADERQLALIEEVRQTDEATVRPAGEQAVGLPEASSFRSRLAGVSGSS
ncbi:hypothetical protein ACWC4A_24905 [Streptomyces mirabilis]